MPPIASREDSIASQQEKTHERSDKGTMGEPQVEFSVPAGFAKRWGAYTVDSLILISVSFALVACWFLLTKESLGFKELRIGDSSVV